MINHFVHHEITILPIDALAPHPDNRPLGIEPEKVNQLAEGIRQFGYYSSQPIVVRPKNGGYEIIKGEHRWRACKQLGYTEIPCTIVEYSDDEALVQLIAGNTQSENCPLDVGAAAYKYCKKGINRYSDNERSLNEFAKLVGYSKSSITEYVAAFHVLDDFRVRSSELCEKARVRLKGCTKHLVAIYQAPRSVWPVLIILMLEKDLTVQDTRKAVKRAQEYKIPQGWESLFLPLPHVVYRGLSTAEFSPLTITKIIEAVETAESRLLTYKIDHLAYICELRNWLIGNCFRASWDPRKIVEKGRELQAKAEAEEREAQERFLFGDWRDHVGKLPNESVSLLLTDPPYGIDYQSDYRLDREIERKHEPIQGDSDPEAAAEEIRTCLDTFFDKLKPDAHVLVFCSWSTEPAIRLAIKAAGYSIRGSLVWLKNNTGMGDPTTTFAPKHERIIHAVKGSPVLFSRAADAFIVDRCNSERHPTEKPVALLKKLIEVTTAKGELVVDPFAGVASTLVAAKALERAFFGCEIEEGYFNQGTERL